MELRRVVITGLGAITPLGNSVPAYWDSLLKGVSGAGPITRFDAEKFKTKFACTVKNFDPNAHFDRKEVKKLDLYAQYAIVAADQAFADAGLNAENTDPDRAGVIWGSGIGGIITCFQEIKGYIEGGETPRFSPFFIPKMIADIAAGHISMKHNLRGPNYCTISACASSNHAIIDAFNTIRLGKADIMVTGGSEASVNEASVGGFNALQALSTRNDDYKAASRPFDSGRDGFVIGEGSGALVLEEYSHAIARGAKIYAEVVGGGMTADAYHLTAPHPDGLGASNSMRMALNDAGIEPTAIDYINVHGTSTPLGDIAEIKSVKNVFGDHAKNLNISSTKSMTGHLLGAAGAVEAIACILAITKGIIPPTINNENFDPELDPELNYTLNKAQKREVNYALSNTFGFGGHNATVILKKHTN